MIQVCFDSPKAWAMLNYCRDHAMELHEPDQTWEELEDDYCVAAPDMGTAERLVTLELPSGLSITEIRVHHESVIIDLSAVQ